MVTVQPARVRAAASESPKVCRVKAADQRVVGRGLDQSVNGACPTAVHHTDSERPIQSGNSRCHGPIRPCHKHNIAFVGGCLCSGDPTTPGFACEPIGLSGVATRRRMHRAASGLQRPGERASKATGADESESQTSDIKVGREHEPRISCKPDGAERDWHHGATGVPCLGDSGRAVQNRPSDPLGCEVWPAWAEVQRCSTG